MKLQLIATNKHEEAWLGPTEDGWVRIAARIVTAGKLVDVCADISKLRCDVVTATILGRPEGKLVAICYDGHIWYLEEYHDRFAWLASFVGDQASPDKSGHTSLDPLDLEALAEPEVVRIRLENNLGAFAKRYRIDGDPILIDAKKSWQMYSQHLDVELYRMLTSATLEDLELLLLENEGDPHEYKGEWWITVVSAATTHWMVPQRQAVLNMEQIAKVALGVFDTLDWVRVSWSPKTEA